eukprot:365778-Chlamydomonas_euryale.AAC.18
MKILSSGGVTAAAAAARTATTQGYLHWSWERDMPPCTRMHHYAAIPCCMAPCVQPCATICLPMLRAWYVCVGRRRLRTIGTNPCI